MARFQIIIFMLVSISSFLSAGVCDQEVFMRGFSQVTISYYINQNNAISADLICFPWQVRDQYIDGVFAHESDIKNFVIFSSDYDLYQILKNELLYESNFHLNNNLTFSRALIQALPRDMISIGIEVDSEEESGVYDYLSESYRDKNYESDCFGRFSDFSMTHVFGVVFYNTNDSAKSSIDSFVSQIDSSTVTTKEYIVYIENNMRSFVKQKLLEKGFVL